VFYQKGENSKILAQFIQNNLNELSNDKSKKVKQGDYYILNKTKELGVLVECGFLSNAEERDNLLKESYQRKIASKIVSGMIEYFNNLSN
jgi:N-acetylmuramoyl-L-alanine amidase